jgi:NAD(P)-dependent dehydrogenase (short-subunit alcohol dehydrogenase family)
MSRLKDKVAIVFGAGSSGVGWGNGKAAAVQYAREGAKVAVADLRQEAVEETAEIIRGERGDTLALVANATNSDEVAGAIESCVKQFGRLDILHNNVGITDIASLEELDVDRWRKVLDVNLTSAFLACKFAIPHMLANASGAIVNISSTAAQQINDYPFFSYYASKAGVNHFTRAVAIQYGRRGIRCNAIMPGLIDTPLIYEQISKHYSSREEMVAARNALSPTGFMGDAWDVARAAVFLASDEARYINGVCLPVDGGLSCR